MMVTIGTVHDLTAQHAATVSRLVETWEQQSFFIEAWSDFLLNGAASVAHGASAAPSSRGET
jgi:hypothetical protein